MIAFVRACVALGAMAALFVGSSAQAEPSPGPTSEASLEASAAKSSSSSWYGGQILAVDAATLALGGGGVAVLASDLSKPTRLGLGIPMLSLAAFSYVFASPIVHAVHGHPLDPSVDPTMRNAGTARIAGLGGGLIVGFFSALALSGGIGDRPPSYRTPPAATIVPLTALGLGLALPIVLDATLFAYEPRGHARGVQLGAQVGPTGASLSGTFD
jgi:hypothetical protein